MKKEYWKLKLEVMEELLLCRVPTA